MFVLFLFLGLKIHSNYDLRIGEKNGRNQESDKIENQMNSKFKEISLKKKEGGRYNCEIIKFSHTEETNNSPEKRFILETDLDYETFLKCDNAKYNPNQNNVEIDGTVMNGIGKHINDQTLDALIVIKNADFRCTSSLFRASSSSNNDAQVIHFLGEGVHTITNTDFKWCGKNPYLFKKDNERLLEDFDPTLIVFDDSSKNFISGGQFYHSEKESPQSFDVFPARCIRTKKTCSLTVSGTYFYNATAYHRGSFFLLDSSEDAYIIHSYFEACYDRENYAHAICANQGMVDIKDCNFNNVLMNPSSSGSIIRADTKSFNFEGNNIKFDNPSINCRCIYIPNSGTFNMLHNEFKNIEINQNSAAIYIEKPSDISFNNNEFDNLIGTGIGHALLLTFDTLEDKPLVGNKFQNIPSGDGLIFIRSADDIETNYTFKNWRLEHIQQNGGGIINVDNVNNVKYGLELINCYFGSNTNEDGGALLVNQETFPNCYALFIIDSNFMFNEARGKGGSIAITVDADIIIVSESGEGTNFNLNQANIGGGAIYIKPTENTNQKERKCTIKGVKFNRNCGKDSHSIWVDVSSFNDNFYLELLDETVFADNNGHWYVSPTDRGACCLCNCKAIKVDRCTFKSDNIQESCGGINVTAKALLEVTNTEFRKCNAGSAEGSYGGGIGYSYIRSDQHPDQSREEGIYIKTCTFDGGVGQNGVALLMHMSTLNANISEVYVQNHVDTSYIFCIFFYTEADNELFTIKDAEFKGNSYNSKLHDGDCGGSGIWIAEAKPQDYLASLTVQFEDCHFTNNHSPGNGGAFGYDTSERLKGVDLIFTKCEFTGNTCDMSGGACHFATKKTVEIYDCNFDNNICQGTRDASGGGAISFYSSVELAIITKCTFSNCAAPKGSIMYTNGGIKGVNISHCTFSDLNDQQNSSVHLDVDSSARTFIFEHNDFINLTCVGDYGGSGLHIGTGRDCEISSCTFSGNKGEGQIIVPDSSNHKLIFNNCIFEQGDGGSRAIYIKGESSAEFSSCQFQSFNNINDPTGRGLLVYSVAERKNPLFYNCTFENVLCVSAFDFENCLTIQISDCTFKKVEAKLTGKGAFLFMKKATHFSITNCNLTECGSPDKTNDKPCFGLCESVETAEIINCSFIKCGRNGDGAAVSAQKVTDILIHNCYFRENMATGTSGDTLSVFIGTGSKNCEISNCHVSSRRGATIENIYQFRVYSENVIFVNNLFDKYKEKEISLTDKGFSGINFDKVKNLIIANNTFETRNAAVYATDIQKTDIYNNTWQELYGETPKGPPRGLFIRTTNPLTFRNNTFAKCPSVDNRIMVFDSNEVIIEDCIFIENKFIDYKRWGGIGMTFDRTNFKVIFRNCVFRGNEGNVGGAVQFGGPIAPNPNGGSIELYSCHFEGNKASDTGGALSFTSKNNNIVQDCTFNDNIAGKNGGAVSIIPVLESGDCGDAGEGSSTNSIINCQFNSNVASPTGHSLFIMNRGKSIVEGCTFVNEKPESNGGMLSCQRSSSFASESGLVEVHNTTFESSGSNAKVCGIDVIDQGISIVSNCIFTNFQQSSSSEGNAIRLRNNGILNEIYDNVFNNCGKGGYVAFCSGDGIDFYHNKFIFDKFSESCGCIKINCQSSSQNVHHNISENHFHDCQVNANNGDGVLCYDCNQAGEATIRSNVFENLKGWIAAFDIKCSLSVTTIFDNNTILNNIPGDGKQYLCGFNFKDSYIAQSTFTISNTKFINNECKSPCGGGIGLWIDNNYKLFGLQFENCIFERNHAVYFKDEYDNGKGGAVEFGLSSKTRPVSPTFTNCQFNHNKADTGGGALSLAVTGSVCIEGCSFYNNTAQINPNNQTDCGGAVYFKPIATNNNKYSIINSSFISNKDPVATALFVDKSSNSIENSIEITDNCQFIDNGQYANENSNDIIVTYSKQFSMRGSSIKFTNPSVSSPRGIKILGHATIENVLFSNINGNDMTHKASSIYVVDGSGQVKIDKCIFTDCGCGRFKFASILVESHASTEISGSTFNYTDVKNASGAIRVTARGKISILNNYFFNLAHNEAPIYYDTHGSAGGSEDTNIEGNVIDNVKPGSLGAIYIRFVTENMRFYNNTIQNLQNVGYILQFKLYNNAYNLQISHCTFRNLACKSQFGGGAGLWAQRDGNGLFSFAIDECTFENSHALCTSRDGTLNLTNGYGGGLQFGLSRSISNVDLKIRGCTFRGNKADMCGGALSLGMQLSFSIDDCIFENNIGGVGNNNDENYGGALYIDYRNADTIPDRVTINHCTFRNNTAHDGNAIFISNLPNTEICIQDNTVFEDNCLEGKSSDLSAIFIDSRSLIIDSITVTYKNSGTSSRGIETRSISNEISNSLFTNCYSKNIERANAIWVRDYGLSCHIKGCTFIDNGADAQSNVIKTGIKDFSFEDSTIKFTKDNINARGILVAYSSKFNVFNSSFIKCQFDKAPDACAGIQFDGHNKKIGYIEDIRIEKSIFDSNNGKHTSNIFLRRINTYPILNNLTFKGNPSGKYTLTIYFAFTPQEEFCVDNIIFENNYFENLDGGGSGIWIAEYNSWQTARNSWPLTFNKCTFRNNHAKQSGGAVAYGDSPTLSSITLTFNECQFIGNECEGKHNTPGDEGGGALWFNSLEPVNVSNCVFRGNHALRPSTRATGPGGYGHAIYAASRSLVTVEKCKFIDNIDDNGIESVIHMSGQQFNLTDSEISFTKSGEACRGIYIDFPGTVNIRNTIFRNCGKNKVEQGGAILYKNANADSVLEEQITIEGCTFDNCLAKNGCAMLFWASVPPTLIGNEILNQRNGKYVISIFYTTFQDYSIVENMNFIGGTSASEDGGASGIWIANNQEISNGRPSELIFRNCRWEDNYSPNRGGALHYGNSKTLIGTELTFEDCVFINNRATNAGGAVSIATISPSVFRNCEFNGNVVEKKNNKVTQGSAIYVDSETPLCLISGCTFTNSSADEGNAIFASSQVLALHVTDNTKIINCGSSGSCIAIESKEFFFLNSQITFDNINKAARGIYIKTLSVTRISDSKFVKCMVPGTFAQNKASQGGAIYIENIVETDSQEEVQLLYSTFDACKAANGCAIMFWIQTNPIIKGNTITNHNYNRYIFTIIRTTNFADLFTIENCTFVKNKYSNKNKEDGGGAAIWIANQEFFNEGELSQLLFKDCNWTKNTGVFGGAFSYGKSNTVKYIQLEFENCHFENNQATGPQGGALHITTVSPVAITGCTFYNNKCVNNIQNLADNDQALGGAIYFDTNSTFVNIINTTFRKNSAQNGNAIFISERAPYIEISDTHFLSNSNGNVGAQVAHQGVELRAVNTNFDYQVVTLHSKGVDILSKSKTTFIDCNFTLCETPYDKGGALFVQDQLNSPNNEDLSLQHCIFDNCNSSEGSAIYASLSTKPTIERCIIKNNNQGCSIFVFKFTETINEINISYCEFIGNEYLNTEEKVDGGGSGILISNVRRTIFHHCEFIGNKAEYAGGALAYGQESEIKGDDNDMRFLLEFEQCYFEENVCNGKYGGALYLTNSKEPVLETKIKGCLFINNRPLASSGLKGGDIYIDGQSAKVQIIGSAFQSSLTQIEEGNAIYCSSNAESFSLSGATFNNCGKQGTVIVSYAKENQFIRSNLMFDEAATEKSARGVAIYLSSESTTTNIQDCIFVNCFFNSQDDTIGGGGIYVKYNGDGTASPEFKLNSCKFEGTSAHRGAAMFLDISSISYLKDIDVMKCTSSTNIVYVKYTNPTESISFDNCHFTENKLTSSNDGGGSGILISQIQKISFSGCSFIGNTAAGHGGAFAYYNSQDAKNTELEFNGCTFNGNSAQSNGGALYLDTVKPISITGCTFDNNTANGNSGALYVHSGDNIKIELTNIARNKASSKAAALTINNGQVLEFNNNTISDNTCASSPSSVEINNDGTANIAENNFDFDRQSDNQYQISLTGSSSSAVCNFKLNCFTHKGKANNNLIHILSTHAGKINVPEGNCFDSGQYNSLQHNGGPSSVGDSVFDCKQCGEIYVPTAAPVATPTASRQMTSKPTDIPLPTEKPYIPTPVATPLPSGESDVTSSSSSSSSSSNNNNNNQSSNKGKKRSVQIAMIAGITAAITVVICVVIILLWLFIFRRRRSNNSPQGGMDSNIPSTNDDTISGVSGVNTTPQDDPIWAGATATHDNPLFNGSEDQDDDQMMHTGFEESWGENVI